MKILFLAAEVSPFVKVGGLADVAGSLPLALAALGHDVRVAMPRYDHITPELYNLKKVVEYIDVPIGAGATGVAVFEGCLPTHEGGSHVPVYFIQNQHHFERQRIYGYEDDADRFMVFCRASLMMLYLLDWKPDLIHANDWHTGLVPTYLKTIYRYDPILGNIRTAFTIHNLAYQGIFDKGWLRQAGLEQYGLVWGDRDGAVNVMGRAIANSDAVSTVSPAYASEILTGEYGENLDWLLNYRWGHLWGILNGIDYTIFNPATDQHLICNYDLASIENRAANKLNLQQRTNLPQNPKLPIIGMISRLVDQKGFDLITTAGEWIVQKEAQLVILGTGDQRYIDYLRWLSQRYPEKVAFIPTFDAGLAQKIYAGSDFFLMPSRFEPCGLGQLIAMRYGSVPIVRHTGGLADTVQEYNPLTGHGNGFLFGPYDALHMLGAIDRALHIYHQPEEWKKLVQINMKRNYSWEASAQQYLDFYQQELGLS
jgi:starch synthase